jgi:hypothetical protein
MESDVLDLMTRLAWIIPVVWAVTERLKTTFQMSGGMVTILSAAVAMMVGAFVIFADVIPYATEIGALALLGLAASGIYDVTKIFGTIVKQETPAPEPGPGLYEVEYPPVPVETPGGSANKKGGKK